METAFSYKQGSSFLHCCPAWVKILILPLISLSIFYLPPYFALVLIALQTLVSFILRFTVREQARDLKAVFYYAVFLIFVKIIGNLAAVISDGTLSAFELASFPQTVLDFLISEKETWLLLLKLFCIIQTASLIFKTSTSLQIREGLEVMELAVRRSLRLKPLVDGRPNASVAQAVSLFICFIPQVSKNWQQAERAWKARGGRKSLRMFAVLLPVFFSVGMKQAYNSARAISARTMISEHN
jgi:biotin transport system permease protein/energy-coupling factor transport system permease protein